MKKKCEKTIKSGGKEFVLHRDAGCFVLMGGVDDVERGRLREIPKGDLLLRADGQELGVVKMSVVFSC